MQSVFVSYYCLVQKGIFLFLWIAYYSFRETKHTQYVRLALVARESAILPNCSNLLIQGTYE